MSTRMETKMMHEMLHTNKIVYIQEFIYVFMLKERLQRIYKLQI